MDRETFVNFIGACIKRRLYPTYPTPSPRRFCAPVGPLTKGRKRGDKHSPPSRLIFPFAIFFFLIGLPLLAKAEPPSGIQPLRQLHESNVHSLITDPSVRPLLTAQEQEAYLIELEKKPPQWDKLHDPPGEEHGARLFTLNRHRDDLREEHPLLKQRIAFVWSGIAHEYHDGHQGLKVVMGPNPTQTTWGIVRFKPTGLPNEMVALPPPSLLPALKTQMREGKPLEIGILFTGMLIPWESIIYGFSHDGLEQGMVMPVVQIDGVQYFISNP